MLAWIKVALRWNIVVLVILHVVIITEKSRGDHVKVCTFETPITIGTRREGDQVTSRCQRCEDLRNCSTVVGSVHLKGIYLNNNKELKRQIRFPNLKEITGSLIVTFLGDVPSLSDILPNLAVIHGHVSELFKDFSLVVYLNDGLEVLGMNSLTVVRQGGIMIGSNQKLCYLDRIRWKSLMNNGLNEGRYELSISGNSNDCFEKCLGCRTPSGHGSSGIAYCWGGERDNCQKLCHSNCGSHGCISGTQEECCHAQCLGGCSQAGSPFHCNGCQHLRLQSGECVEKCPAGLKEVNEFTCEPNCSKPLLDYNGKCVNDCPAGYTANRTVCSRCPTNSCPRVCTQSVFNPTIKINLLSDSARLKGCTVINGDLEIEMRNAQGSVNIAQVLSEDLQSVEEVNGYVVVRQSSSLVSLNFFKNLKKIDPGPGTRSAFSERYALAIFDNPNLESLWDFDPNFRILNHGVFVQLNPRLCPQSIYPMFDDILGWNRSDPGENRITVSRTTNGNARQCNVQLISINVTGIQDKRCKDLCVEVSWPITIKDYRDLLLYSIWYRETTNRDLNEYDGVDACNSNNVWKRHDVGNTKGKSRERIGGLNAFTLYAFRLEGFVIANTGVKSSIAYFKTKQTKPSRPLGLDVSFLSASSLQVKWKKPFYPNGDITHYEVRYKQSYSTYRWNKNVDWCKNQGFTTLPSTGDENDNEGKPTVSTCSANITCECDKDKPKKLGPELKAALFSKEFQDEILSSVFQKIDTDDDDTKITTRATLPTTPGRPLCTNDSKNSSCTGSSSSATEPSAGPTTASSTGNSSLPPTELQKNTTNESIVLNGLMYFTEYSVEVCACNSGARCGTNKGFLRQCSEAVGRTQKSDTADDVGDTLTVWVNNKTKKFSLAWNAPVRPNGIVLRYDVWIQNGNETKPEVVCVLSSTTEYSRSSASLGQYTARVRAITPAGNGSWSNDVVFVIAKAIGTPAPVKKSEDVKLATIVGISLTILLVLIILFAVAFYRHIRKRYKQKEEDAGVIYASVNPEYWNCSEVYVPDEWEVARDKIKITRELGNGSFGMVYEGEAKDILPGQESCMVAVKTVSDNCSIRDKVDFLKEASIMKAFNCNHVVRLLGVVSAGHPVLVVMELMENGDLKSFLRRRRPSSSDETPNSLPPPTDHELYQMAAEIADGMAYLSDRKFVHRDLAARNCMVSSSCTCKIGDFGMARDVYETDYYRKGGKGFLPVRWMAPESLKDGVFTSASDVWSFGVVLWEMATLAEQPYQGKSNEEVMKVVTDGHRMDAPEACPEVLADLMMQCWQFKPKLRPSFVTVVCSLAQYTSKEFAERSFYFNQRGRQETSSSCQTTLTEKEDLGDLPKDSKENPAVDNDPQESVV